jgi:hypothetical protein
MEYEIKNFCDFTNLQYERHNNTKINVVSLSLFKMTQGYKRFDKYINGFDILMKNLVNKLPNFRALLFVDNTIIEDKQLFDRIKRYKQDKLIIIQYHCPRFIKDKKHIELFGTLMRFLPFFDFPENFTDFVISSDIDVPNISDLNNLNDDYRYFSKIKSDFNYDPAMFSELYMQHAIQSDDYHILAGRFMGRTKFPISILTNFLSCVLNKSCSDIKVIQRILDYDKYDTFPYGIDEYFLNNVLIKYIKEHHMTHSVVTRYMLNAPFYYLMQYTLNPERSDKYEWFHHGNRKKCLGIMMGIMKKTLLNKYDNIQDPQKVYDIFDDIFYKRVLSGEITGTTKKMAKIYYDEIQKMYDEKNYDLFERKTLKKILSHKKDNVISKVSIITFSDGKEIKRYYSKKSLK